MINRTETKRHYGQRLVAALTAKGWEPESSTATHTVWINGTRTSASGGLRRLFIGHASGQIHSGDSWSHCVPMPTDWAARLIVEHETKSAGRSTVASGKLAAQSAAADLLVEFGL